MGTRAHPSKEYSGSATRVLMRIAIAAAAENNNITAVTPANFAKKKISRLTGLLRMEAAVPRRISCVSDEHAA